MSKLDLKKEWKQLYTASAKTAALIEVPDMNYVMIDGEGDPNTEQSFQDAVEALYRLLYDEIHAEKGRIIGRLCSNAVGWSVVDRRYELF